MGSTREWHCVAGRAPIACVRHQEGARVKFSDTWEHRNSSTRKRKLSRNLVTSMLDQFAEKIKSLLTTGHAHGLDQGFRFTRGGRILSR